MDKIGMETVMGLCAILGKFRKRADLALRFIPERVLSLMS